MNYDDTPVGREPRNCSSISQGPFRNASNIHLFYGGGDRGAIVAELSASLRQHQPLSLVFGEPGSGKSLLSLVLADRLRHRFNIIRYDRPRIGRALILRHLLIELCPQDAGLIRSASTGQVIGEAVLRRAERRLENALAATRPDDKPLVFLVDSNADSSADTLQLLRRLAAVRRAGRPVMHIVSFQRIRTGTLHSQHRVATPASECGQLCERHYWLRRLSLAEIDEYLRHQMMLFDFTLRDSFTPDMVYFVADRSNGVFRSINTLLRTASIIARLEGKDRLSMSQLMLAGLPQGPQSSPRARALRRYRQSLVALVGFCVVVSCIWLMTLL